MGNAPVTDTARKILKASKITRVSVVTIVVTIFALASLLSLFVVTVTSQNVTRYYAGYYLGKGYYGIAGDIYTISPSVYGNNFVAQWVDISISLSRHYWIQVGCDKGYDTNYKLKFYVEKMDAKGYSLIWVPNTAPAPGVTYNYVIVGGIFNGGYRWEVIIRRGITNIHSTVVYTVPYTSEDLHAFSETTTTSINIDNTHFSFLSYYTGLSFPLWNNRHVYVNSPYRVQEISDYEFRAGDSG